MKKRIFPVLALLMSLVMLLAACGSPAPAAPSGGEASVPAKAPDAPAAPAEDKTIVYWSMWESTEPQGKALQTAIDAFTAETGIAVHVEFKGRTGQREGLQPALDANTTIDLFDEDIDRINTTFAAYLMDIDQFVKASDYEATANAGLIKACRELGGGTLKSIPYQPNVVCVFYNQDIFDASGITAAPKTWTEFMAVCEKIKAAGFIPMTNDDAYMTLPVGTHLARYIGEDGVKKVVTEGLWAEEPGVLKMAQDFEAFAKAGYYSPNLASNVWPGGQNGEFALGEVGMYLTGSWLPNEVKDIAGPDFRWGAFSYPAVDGGKDGAGVNNFGAQVFAINAKSAVAEETFQLIQWLTKGQYDALLATESLGIPADSSNTEWPAVLECVKPVMAGLTGRYSWASGVETNVDITPIIKENFTKLCAGTITAQEFVDNMEKASNG